MRGLRQVDVKQHLRHDNTKHYQDIEAGRIFPGAKILFRLLALYRVELSQAYPVLKAEADEDVKQSRAQMNARGVVSNLYYS